MIIFAPMRILLLLLFSCVLFAGCDNELDINQAWVETPVVYGFIDAHQDTQYIRVEKTYLNSADMTIKEGAQYADSIYYPESMKVILIGDNGRVDTFERVTMPKEPGVFSGSGHVVYKKAMRPSKYGIDVRYKLRLFNQASGKSFESPYVSLIDTANFIANGNSVNIYPADAVGNMGTIFYGAITGKGSKIGDLFIRFLYKEYYLDGTSADLYVDYNLERNYKLYKDNIKYSTYFKSLEFVKYLKYQLPAKSNVAKRTYTGIKYYATGGNDDLAYVIDLSKPSTTITPKNTQYTNIDGALGLFTCVSVKVITPEITRANDLNTVILTQLPQFQN